VLDIVLREDGYRIDKIVATTGAAPAGVGPDESARSGLGPSVSQPELDSDQDGLPDALEMQLYGHVTDVADENSDFDCDGSRDVIELIAGTDPSNVSSVFRVSGISMSKDEIVLRWSSEPGKIYTVYRSDNLSSGTWLPILTQIPSEGVTTSRAIAVGSASQFFRIGVAE